MNLSMLKRIKVGAFITYVKLVLDDLPASMAREKAALQTQYDEMMRMYAVDRRNHVLAELKTKDFPRLKELLRMMVIELNHCEASDEKAREILNVIRKSFKQRQNLTKMINDAMIVAECDAPAEDLCALIFSKFKALANEMYAKIAASAEEDARISALRGSLPARDEALKILMRIRVRASAMRYEEATSEVGEQMLLTLGIVVDKARQTLSARRRNKPRCVV